MPKPQSNQLEKQGFFAKALAILLAPLHIITGLFQPKRSYEQTLSDEFQAIYGKDSLWFSGNTSPRPDEPEREYVTRRYAQSLAGIFSAAHARKNGAAIIQRSKGEFRKAGLVIGAVIAAIFLFSPTSLILITAPLVALILLGAVLAFANYDYAALLRAILPGTATAGQKESALALSETLLRTSAVDAPEDLRDLYRLPFIDTSGAPLSERMYEMDLTTDYFADDVYATLNKAKTAMFRTVLRGAATSMIVMLTAGSLLSLTGMGLAAKAGLVIGVILAIRGVIWSVNALSDTSVGARDNRSFAILAGVVLVSVLFSVAQNNDALAMVSAATWAGAALTAVVFMWAGVWFVGKTTFSQLDRRALDLATISEKSIDQIAQQAGVTSTLLQEDRAREAQIANAKADQTPFFELGKSTGFLRDRYDPFAPSVANMPLGLTFNDLSTHMIVLGGTGSGKTSGTIRPLVKQWLADDEGGLLILDGKGQLPAEIEAEGYQLITPSTQDLNPIEGLSPDDVADTLVNLAGDRDDNSDPYWNNSAAKLVRSAAHVARVLAEIGHGTYNLTAIYEITSYAAAQEAARNHITDEVMDTLSGAAKRGVHYALVEFPLMPEKPRNSITNIAGLWLSQITDNEKLSSWADADTGYEIEATTRGARVGVLLPESIYGKAGVLVSGLLKKRVYEAIKRRGDKWQTDAGETPVLVVIDEVQEILTDDELNMLPIARSLGLYAAFSTQNVEGILNRLGEHAGYQLLGNLRSLVAYQTQTERTVKYIAERMGSSYRPVVEQTQRYEDLSARLKKTYRYQKNADQATTAGTQYANGIGALSRTVGNRIAGLPRTVIDYMLHPEKRQRQMESYSSGSEYDWEAVVTNQSIQSAEHFENWGVLSQNLKLTKNVEPEEVNEILSEPNTALVQVVRGRVTRRDLVTVNPIYDMSA